MGTPSAVTISNLYLHTIETNAIYTMLHPPKLYTRYIDDIFAIVPSIEYKNTLLQSLNSQDINIKVTDESNDTSINYLDITIYKTTNMLQTDKLQTTLYHKPISKFLYLHPNSFQPTHIKTNVITNELKRIHKTCSSPREIIKHRELYFRRLCFRLYRPHILQDIFRKPISTKQQLLHLKKIKKTISSPILITNYHPFIIAHKKRITHTLTLPKNITNKYPHLSNSKPIIAYKNNSNIYQIYKQLRKKHTNSLNA